MPREPQPRAQLAPLRLDMGATPTAGATRFRVWAPTAQRVEVELELPLPADGGEGWGEGAKRYIPMQLQPDGSWLAIVPNVASGTRYKYRLNGGASFPDPCSRFQPEGVHGPSEVVDPDVYTWQDQGWRGLANKGLVIYECHVGTATPQGTFDSLIGQLDRLKSLGVTAIELMPVAEFSGRWNWGYDGVYPYAPTRNYGGPDGLKRLVDAAHQRGLGVILDVVYNHLGPEGNYLRQFSPYYFTERYKTPWGEAINYDGPYGDWVRKYFVDNACYWVHEYHVDGLRLDATFAMHDSSQPHVLQELTGTVRGSLPPGHQVVLNAETHENDVRYLLPVDQGGYGFDAVWVDDFHHTLRRYLVREGEGYYVDYQGTLAELARTINQGFLFEGQLSRFLKEPRGTRARQQPAWQFQYHIQTHDQVGNRAFGDRLHHSLDLDRYRAASALFLMLPYTPMLFMGQEYAASQPFQYFTDHPPELGRLVTEGRRKEFASFSLFSDPAAREHIPDPQAESTFLRSKLELDEIGQSPGGEVHRLYKELLHLRHADPVLARQDRHAMRAHALSDALLAVHLWHADTHRLILANFGPDTSIRLTNVVKSRHREAAPRASPDAPLTQPWRIVLDTADSRFGGHGKPATLQDDLITLPARSAALLATP